MIPELLAPPLVRCTRCRQLDDLSQMQGIGREAICGPYWLIEARKRHQTDRRESYLKIWIEEA
jgi:hypothetical protein